MTSRTLYAYRKIMVLNGCNQGLVEFVGFHFLIKQFLQFIEGKSSNQIILESVDTDTRACAIGRLEWRVA